ncbi:MAG: methyltransferase domain-containing protein [Phycisphaerales bacterium]|nr:methyltransferase domain-containing protein [Phycisphaerales bacterium]
MHASRIERIPPRLSARWRPTSEAGLDRLRGVLVHDLFSASAPGYLDTPEGRNDLANHLTVRQDHDRRQIVPWLDAACGGRLDGARVLEIGAGTGSGTLAIAEQGAIVTGVDICERSLHVARERLAVHGLSASLHACQATDIADRFPTERFDWIIFWASLEHMVHAERVLALRRAWDMLPPGGLLCVIEAPNRLWYKDTHTSLLPFFHWLPDELAYDYAALGPREVLGAKVGPRTDESMLRFLRRGRGVSFHEFELALGPATALDVVSSRSQFERAAMSAADVDEHERSSAHRFAAQLAAMAGRPMHEGWFQPWLDLVIRKP